VDIEVKGPTKLNYKRKPVLISKQTKLKPIITKLRKWYTIYRDLMPLLKISKHKIFSTTNRSANKVNESARITPSLKRKHVALAEGIVLITTIFCN
jgi:hypothetical protein